MDSDGSLPMTNVARSFEQHPQWIEKLRAGNVFVLPGFNVSTTTTSTSQDDMTVDDAGLAPALSVANLPADKESLLGYIREGQVSLSEKTWKKTIRNVDFNAWAGQTRLSAIQNYDPYFSPSVVMRRDKMLWCPERFGDNHAACMFELYLSGADFWVLPNDFTVNAATRPENVVSDREVSLWLLLYPERKRGNRRCKEKATNSMCYLQCYFFSPLANDQHSFVPKVSRGVMLEACACVLCCWRVGL